MEGKSINKTKRICHTLLVLALFSISCITISSCDIWGYYYYHIENNLSDKTVTIHFEDRVSKDSIIVLKPNERRLVDVTETDFLSLHERPDDIIEEGRYQLGEFKVYIDGELIDLPLWESKYWKYEPKCRRGDYYLIIDKETIQ